MDNPMKIIQFFKTFLIAIAPLLSFHISYHDNLVVCQYRMQIIRIKKGLPHIGINNLSLHTITAPLMRYGTVITRMCFMKKQKGNCQNIKKFCLFIMQLLLFIFRIMLLVGFGMLFLYIIIFISSQASFTNHFRNTWFPWLITFINGDLMSIIVTHN